VARDHEDRSFVRALNDEMELLAEGQAPVRGDRCYILRSLYGRQLQRLLHHFPADQVLFVKSEHMFADLTGTYDRVCDFLGAGHHGHRTLAVANEGRLQRPITADERRAALPLFADDVEVVETITGWDCGDWRR
jgi:hypothetical protein